MTDTEMAELVKRLEAADGPDRDLDRALGIACLGWKPGKLGRSDVIVTDDCTYADHPGGEYPALTESIDAALTLLPDGWDADVRVRAGVATAWIDNSVPLIEVSSVVGQGRAALALAAVGLKARIHG